MPSSQSVPDDTSRIQRERMVAEQLQARNRDIRDERVLEAMRTVPREEFVPEDLRLEAYQDCPLPIGHDQTISQPFIVAYMCEILDLKPTDRVLEIGAGCGYQTAVLASLTAEVYAVEIIPELAAEAVATLERLGFRNAHIRQGDGWQGWAEEAPFDAVIVACAAGEVPQALVDQLSDGGRMIIPVGGRQSQSLHLLTKENDRVLRREVMQVRFVPMTGGPGTER